MKTLVTLVALTAVLVLVLTSTPPAFASSGWGLEDPQLCVNGQLLKVIPGQPADVYVTVPKGAEFGATQVGCSADTTQLVPPGNVTVQGGNMLRVTADAPDGTLVTFTWGQTVIDVAKHGEASAKFKTK